MVNVKIDFTVDEMNLICLYEAGSRSRRMIIDSLTEAFEYLDDGEMRKLVISTLSKLMVMEDENFRRYKLKPDYDIWVLTEENQNTPDYINS